METRQVNGKYSPEDILKLFDFRGNGEGAVKTLLTFVGAILTPITLAGALWFYVRSYRIHLRPLNIKPVLSPMLPVTRTAMMIGGLFVWGLIIIAVILLWPLAGHGLFGLGDVFVYVLANSILTYAAMKAFNRWRDKEDAMLHLEDAYGRNTFAQEQYPDLRNKGIWLGMTQMYSKTGHYLICAGAGGGKATNFLIPNLLGFSDYQGSWFVIDPKGELYSVTARYQAQTGRKVIALNPWELFGKKGMCYNPLELIDPQNNDSVVDDSTLLAQMIVPDSPNEREPFWSNTSRSWITGLIAHLVTLEKIKENDHIERSLKTIWEWVRLPEKEFLLLVMEMSRSKTALVRGVAGQIISLHGTSNTFPSMMANVHEATDFLKSPSLQRSIKESDFNINDLTDGNTTVYVIIPADKLDTQYKWLRLVVSTALLSCVRKPNKRVTFLMDEFNTLGNMKIVQTYMALARGYNISLCPIVQNLGQLQNNYGSDWEGFVANSAVRWYTSINDNFTLDYISQSLGQTTQFTWYKHENRTHDARGKMLRTPGEVKMDSADNIILQIEQRNPLLVHKIPYYDFTGELKDRADKNPYYKEDENKDDHS